MKKYLGWAFALLLLVAGVYGTWRWQKGHAAPEVQFKTAPSERRRVAAKVTASGTLQAKVTVQIGAQVSGRLTKINVDFNSTVKKGELIAKLDPQLYMAALGQAKANHSSAKAGVLRAEAQLKDAELVLARMRRLAEQALASAADLQTAETGVAVAAAATEVAKASLEQATAALNQAQVNLGYTEIFSPIDGTVISRSVDVGQTVAASLQAPVLFTIAEDLHNMQVHTNVSEGDVGRLEPGMEATFTVDAFPGRRFVGRVGQIRNAAQTVQNVVTYDAVIDVDNADLKLRPGMTATATIVWAEKNEVVTVTNAALRFKPPPEVASSFPSAAAPPPPSPSGALPGTPSPEADAPAARRRRGGKGDSDPARTVWTLRNGKPEAVPVLTGLSDGMVTEIASGEVQPGDQLITEVIIAGKSSATSPGAPGGGGPPRMGRMF